MYYYFQDQFSSATQLCLTLWNSMDCSTPGILSITNSRSLLKLMSIELVMPSNHLILCYPFSSCLQSFPASGSFPSSRLLHQVAKVLELQLLHQTFQCIVRVDFRTDWFDLPAVQGNLKSLLQHYSLKHQFFGTQSS